MNSKNPESQGEEMDKLQKELTSLALKVADNFDINLDFTVQSIKNVDKILDIFSKDYKKNKQDEGLQGIALEFAAYIITVIEKWGVDGKWERNHPKIGDETFPYYFGMKTIFPYGWCMNRILNGKEDNIWHKYKETVLKHEQR